MIGYQRTKTLDEQLEIWITVFAITTYLKFLI